MTVRELIEKLEQWPQDTEVATYQLQYPGVADIRAVRGVNYWTSYNLAYVVIGDA